MVDSGAAQRVASTLLNKFGVKKVEWAILIVGTIFGISVFYEVAFIILSTTCYFSIAVEAKIPYLRLGITMVAAATMAHSIFPPQPGPTALVEAYGADMGYGLYIWCCGSCASDYLRRNHLTKSIEKFRFTSTTTTKKSKEFDLEKYQILQLVF